MAAKPKKGLTDLEKRAVKALIAKGWRNQDIHAWINIGRQMTVNFGRISGVKNNPNQQPATDEEVAYFLLHRQAYDAQTGLNRYDDERLIRAREAMILAVQVFNSAGLRFKTEVFTMLANVAIALATKRKIRLLSGGKRRRPSLRPSQLARARRCAPLAWYRTSVRWSARGAPLGQNPDLAAGDRPVRRRRIHPLLV
jgi:hypothetical protein